MDIADEDIDAAIQKIKTEDSESNDSDSSRDEPDKYFNAMVYAETEMMNEFSEYEGDNSMGETERFKNKKFFQCMECDSVFPKREAYIKHIVTHLNSETHSSEFGTRKKKKCKKKKGKKGNKSYEKAQCTVCGYMGANKWKLKDHMVIHSDEKPFSCDQCDFTTKHKLSLRKHIENKHEKKSHKKKSLKCPFPDCDYRGARKDYFKIHLMIHTGDKPYECQHCEYRCVSTSALSTHMALHSGTKPHQCHLCDYKCAVKDGLNKHIRSHTKPFKCSQCEFRCAERPYLKQHMLKHTGEKPFTCHICDYKCVSKTLLNSHSLVHSRETPHACEYCEYATNRKQELTRHVDRIHYGIKPPPKRPRVPKPPKIKSKEMLPPEVVLPQPAPLGPGTMGPGTMGMPMGAMSQMSHMSLGGYQFPHNTF
ncbi:unnamed protein product [Meganyctiphanes norvegica]|uniref:C2H2-type domain-containing protein n=1 Tax=Meganyctiphanes norvegica TaxID=48144 RepID=A0AAV2R6K4_MEGNR